jgi:hypothetical protein
MVFVDTRNFKTNRPLKKGDDKWAGPYEIEAVYPQACCVRLPTGVRIFPVFYNSLLQLHSPGAGLRGQSVVNVVESWHLCGRILEREDGTEELVEK